MAALLMCTLAGNSLYMNVCAFLPQFVALNFPGLTGLDIGILMSIYPLAYLVTAPIIGDKMKYIGRKNTVLIGVIITTLSTLMFGLGGYCTNVYIFFGISFIARMIQGVAESMMNVAIYSIVPIEFTQSQEMYLGWIAMAEGVACALGPLLGSIVYGWLGYIYTFYFFTAYIAIFGFVSVAMIPSRVNRMAEEDLGSEAED
jgi:DHA1 family multidrug resistance protein-like MFS transporter